MEFVVCLSSFFLLWLIGFTQNVCCANETSSPFSSSEDNPINLPNEQCNPRPTLVNVGEGQSYNYFPLIISLSRCGGIVGKDKPSFRKCVPEKYTNVYLNAFNDIYQQSETLVFENHTSCKAECVHDSSVCTVTQMWNPKNCQCECDKTVPEVCPGNYIWNPNLCICECDIACSNKQVINVTSCSCSCKERVYRKCNSRNKFVRETDCKCFLPEALLGHDKCELLPTKWAVVIIIISFCAIFVFGFDVILYTRRTGCLYLSTHLCHKREVQDEKTPIKNHRNSIVTVESTA